MFVYSSSWEPTKYKTNCNPNWKIARIRKILRNHFIISINSLCPLFFPLGYPARYPNTPTPRYTHLSELSWLCRCLTGQVHETKSNGLSVHLDECDAYFCTSGLFYASFCVLRFFDPWVFLCLLWYSFKSTFVVLVVELLLFVKFIYLLVLFFLCTIDKPF